MQEVMAWTLWDQKSPIVMQLTRYKYKSHEEYLI